MNLKDTPLIYMYVNEFLINTAGLFQLILSGKKILCTVAVVCSKKKLLRNHIFLGPTLH